MNPTTASHMETTHMSDHELILELYKRVDALERRVTQLEESHISEGDLESYAESLGLLDDAGDIYK